jgi:hypothetical protein
MKYLALLILCTLSSSAFADSQVSFASLSISQLEWVNNGSRDTNRFSRAMVSVVNGKLVVVLCGRTRTEGCSQTEYDVTKATLAALGDGNLYTLDSKIQIKNTMENYRDIYTLIVKDGTKEVSMKLEPNIKLQIE